MLIIVLVLNLRPLRIQQVIQNHKHFSRLKIYTDCAVLSRTVTIIITQSQLCPWGVQYGVWRYEERRSDSLHNRNVHKTSTRKGDSYEEFWNASKGEMTTNELLKNEQQSIQSKGTEQRMPYLGRDTCSSYSIHNMFWGVGNGADTREDSALRARSASPKMRQLHECSQIRTTQLTHSHPSKHNFSEHGGSMLGCWLALVNSTQTEVSLGEGTLVKELPPSIWSVAMSLEHFHDW